VHITIAPPNAKARGPNNLLGVRALSILGQLVTQPKLINQLAVGVEVDALQIGKETLARADHLEESAPAVVVLGVRPEMISEVVDPFREHRDLHFGRTGVCLVPPILCDGGSLRKSHCVFLPELYVSILL
jgi:hypothetical protein